MSVDVFQERAFELVQLNSGGHLECQVTQWWHWGETAQLLLRSPGRTSLIIEWYLKRWSRNGRLLDGDTGAETA